jgi:hypothetical protein
MADADPKLQRPKRPPSRQQKQLSIRSSKAFDMAKEKARQSGLSVTEVVERALAGFQTQAEPVPEGMVRNGKFLSIKSTGSGPKTNEEANHLIDMLRTEWADE